MYWTSHVYRELTSVIVRCVGQAPTHVTEQAKVAKVGKDVWGDKAEWGTYKLCEPAAADIHMYMRVESLDVATVDKWTRLHGYSPAQCGTDDMDNVS